MSGKKRRDIVSTDIYDKIVSILEAFKDNGEVEPDNPNVVIFMKK